MAGTCSWAELVDAGRGAGLDLVSASSAESFDGTRHDLEARRAAGLNGEMQFTYRNPARSTDPDRTLPGVRTLIAGGASYHRDAPQPPPGPGPAARVARYVWADDHERLLAGLGAMAAVLTAAGHRACVVADQNHLVDRAVAHRAGLGWFGKNANLLVPGQGSWFLLGEVLTDAEVPDAPAPGPVADGCGTCTRCLPACPTGAIVAPGTVDARRCLSWLLQVPGEFPRAYRAAVGDRIYGCDDCQEVCPPNRRRDRRRAPYGQPEQAWVRPVDLLRRDDAELLAAHGHWYIPQRDPRYLRRNALVVLGNVGDGTDPDVRAVLADALDGPDPLLRAHAVWAARRLGCDDLLMAVADDPDPAVRAELDAPVEPRSSR